MRIPSRSGEGRGKMVVRTTTECGRARIMWRREVERGGSIGGVYAGFEGGEFELYRRWFLLMGTKARGVGRWLEFVDRNRGVSRNSQSA